MGVARFITGSFMTALHNVASFIKNTMVEALRTMVRNAARAFGLFAASLVQVQVEMDKFHSIMTMSTSGMEESQRVFDDLAATANTFGLTLEGNLLKEFNKFRTVMVQAGIEGQEFMEIFGNFAQVSNVFHLGAQDLQFAILALTQMVSKGKVSMEEMRRQLAERLPGTMQVAAKAFNTTTRELELAITKGFVKPVPLIQGMMEEFAKVTSEASLKAVNSMEARLGRVANIFFELKRKVLASGVQEVFVQFFERIQNLVGYLIDSGAVERFSRVLSEMSSKLINFLSNTSGLKTWLGHFADNWGQIMMGWVYKILGAFGEGMLMIAKDMKQGFSVKIQQKKEGAGRKYFEGGFLSDIGDIPDLLMNAWKSNSLTNEMKQEVQKTTFGLGFDIADDAMSNFMDWLGEAQAKADENAILLKMAWEAPEDPFVVAENVLRRAEQVGPFSDSATLLSQIGQLTQLRNDIADIVQNMPAKLQTPAFVDEAATLQGQTQDQLDRITATYEAKTQTGDSNRQLSDIMDTAKDASNVFTELDKELEKLSGTLSSTLVDGLMEGKLAFADMANSIVRSMMEIVTQVMIVTPLLTAFRNLVSGFGDFLMPQASPMPNNPGLFAPQSLAYTPAAKGMALEDGSQITAYAKGGLIDKRVYEFAKGGLVKKPTVFPMAEGTGLMGEAGPEAIMPLRRDSKGRLGVSGVGGDGDVKVENNITITAPEGFTAETQQQQNETGGMDTEILFRQIEGRLADRISRRQGPMFQTLQRGGHKGILG